MKRTLLLFFTLLIGFQTYTQNSWITQLPNKGWNCKMVKTHDGGFVFYISEYLDGDFTPKLYKYDADGSFIWVTTLLTETNSEFRVKDIKTTMNQSLILAGSSSSSTVHYKTLIKINESGEIEYENELPNDSWGFWDVVEIQNTYSAIGVVDGQEDDFMHRFDNELNLIEIITTEAFPTVLNHLYKNSNDDHFIWKRTENNDNIAFYADIDLNHIGDDHIYPYRFPECKPTLDGGYILIDAWYDYNDGYVLKIDQDLTEEWINTTESYIIQGVSYYRNTHITPTQDGGYVFAGNVGNILFNTVQFHKIDADGNLLWRQGFDPYPFETVYALEEADDGGIVMLVGGDMYGQQDIDDIYLVKTTAQGQLSTTEIQTQTERISLYPNPAQDNLTFSFSKAFTGHAAFYTTQGKMIHKVNFERQSKKTIDISGFVKGIYFVKIYDKNHLSFTNYKLIKR